MSDLVPRPPLPSWLGFGALVGVAQTIAEGTILGWYGVDLSALDVALFTVSYLGLGIALGLGLFLVYPLLRGVTRTVDDPAAFALGGMGLVWSLALLIQVWGRLGGAAAIALSGGALLAILVLTRAGRGRGPTALFLVPLGVAFVAGTATLLAGQWFEVLMAQRRALLAASLLVPALACVVALRRSGPGARGWLSALPLGVGALVLHVILSLTVWPTGGGWHVDRFATRDGVAEPQRPNVLLLVLDTVRAQSLELFGYPRETMPFLARFARDEAHYHAPILANAAETLPAHASMFTGHFVYSHGAHKPYISEENSVQGYMHHLDERHPTLAQWLGEEGYDTGAISANAGVIAGYGLERGFQEFDVTSGPSAIARGSSWLFQLGLGDRSVGSALRYNLPASLSEATQAFARKRPSFRRAGQIRERAEAWLARRGENPFFLFLNFLDSHNPYYPPPGYRDRYVAPGENAPWEWEGFPTRSWRAALFQNQPMPQDDLDLAQDLYDAELAYLDDELERLFETMRTSGLLDDTLVIIVGDHGEEFWEHGAMLHGGNVYGTQVRVPFIVRLPDQADPTGFAPSPLIQHVDLIDSIAEVVGLAPLAETQGSPWGHGRRYAIAENYVHWGRGPYYQRELLAVQIGDLKYIRAHDGAEELYDLATDPGETRNVAQEHPDVVADARLIAELRDQTVASVKAMKAGAGPVEDPEELRERLRALGYID